MNKDLQLQMKQRFDVLVDDLVAAGFFLEQSVELLERALIERALNANKQNQSEASKVLGIHRNTLQRKMVQYSIDGKRPRRKPVVAEKGRAQAKVARRPRKAS
jgi:DNA-binding NtrC family response regulator